MSRPIAYNTPALAVNGSITNEDAVISYVVDGRGNDYYNGYADRKWVPSADGAAPIVFVTDTFTRGYEGDPTLAVPLFFACAGTSSAAILYTANRLPGSPGNYTDANTALNDLNRTYGYFILESNDPFEGTNATNLRFEVDASKMTSYPQTGTNWYDLSGNGSTGTLQNGVSFNSNGWFNFDGTNDQVATSINRGQLGVAMSVEATFKYTGNSGDAYRPIIGGNDPGVGTEFFLGKNSGNNYFGVQDGNYDGGFVTGYDVFDGRWHHMVYTYNNNTGILYLDGTLRNSGYFSGCNANEQIYIGAEVQEGYWWKGDISQAKYYTQTLSEAGVKQNYFGAPIVTDGLVFAVDANNIVSYPKSGTDWYSLTGSITNTLINGPTFNSSNGGAIVFDGVDDRTYADSPVNENNSVTLETWIYPTGYPTSGGGGFLLSNTGYYLEYASTGVIRSYFYGLNSPGYHNGTINIPLNTWTHVAVVRNQNNNTINHYVNGVLDNTISGITGNINNGSTNLSMGAYSGGGYAFVGKIANGRVYNKALSASEILQNYQAEQYRFEGPQGIVTNGLIMYWDAGNLDSYPGTGTTIYDLSSNSNYGILVNGVAYVSQFGGGLDCDPTDEFVVCNNFVDTNYVSVELFYTRNSAAGNGDDIVVNKENVWEIKDIGGSLEWALYASNQGWFWQPTGFTMSVGETAHVVLTYDGNTVNFYKNGSLYSYSYPAGGVLANQSSSYPKFNTRGSGKFDNYNGGDHNMYIYRIYNRALTQAEVTQNYNAQKSRFGL